MLPTPIRMGWKTCDCLASPTPCCEVKEERGKGGKDYAESWKFGVVGFLRSVIPMGKFGPRPQLPFLSPIYVMKPQLFPFFLLRDVLSLTTLDNLLT